MIKASIFFFLLMTISHSINCFEGNRILNSEDLDLQCADKERPVLSMAFDGSDRQEAFNQWMCFDSDQVQFENEEVKYAGRKKWLPLIIATTLGQRFEFSLYEEFGEDGKEVSKKWEDLYSDSPEICFYASFLQYVKEEVGGFLHSQWILQRIKTRNGQWAVDHKLDENLKEPTETTSMEFETETSMADMVRTLSL